MKNVWFTIALFSALIIGCQTNGPEGSGSEANEEISEEQKLQFAREMISNHPQDEAFDGASIFRSRCAVCHGVKGNLGVNGAGDLTKTQLSLEEKVINIYYGKGAMTPFRGILSESDIVGVARYVEGLKSE